MKKMYSLNDIGAQLGLPSREAPGPRGMSFEYLWDIAAADRFRQRNSLDSKFPRRL